MALHFVTFVTALGPEEADAEVRCEVHPGEPRQLYGRDGSGYPGSPPRAEIIHAAIVLPGGRRRPLTDAEEAWLGEAEAEIAERALAEADGVRA